MIPQFKLEKIIEHNAWSQINRERSAQREALTENQTRRHRGKSADNDYNDFPEEISADGGKNSRLHSISGNFHQNEGPDIIPKSQHTYTYYHILAKRTWQVNMLSSQKVTKCRLFQEVLATLSMDRGACHTCIHLPGSTCKAQGLSLTMLPVSKCFKPWEPPNSVFLNYWM